MISTAAFMAKARELAALLQARVYGARGYRYEGERATHAEQLRETQVALSMMATASDDPDHARMASEIEDGAENRLTVLLGKARLTLEEKRERDAIQAGLQARRQGFAGLAPLSPPKPPLAPLSRFLPAIPAAGGLILSPIAWLAAALALVGSWGAWNHVRVGIVEDQRDEARRVATRNAEAAEGWRVRAEEYREGLVDAASVARHAAAALEQERQRQARAAVRERRRNREIQDVLTGSPDAPDWSLRDVEPPPGSDPATPGG